MNIYIYIIYDILYITIDILVFLMNKIQLSNSYTAHTSSSKLRHSTNTFFFPKKIFSIYKGIETSNKLHSREVDVWETGNHEKKIQNDLMMLGERSFLVQVDFIQIHDYHPSFQRNNTWPLEVFSPYQSRFPAK